MDTIRHGAHTIAVLLKSSQTAIYQCCVSVAGRSIDNKGGMCKYGSGKVQNWSVEYIITVCASEVSDCEGMLVNLLVHRCRPVNADGL